MRGLAFLIIALLCGSLFAQTPPRAKPKLKNFGSSLKKLKWDPERKQAVSNAPPGSDGTADDDVVRIETSLVVCDVLVTDKQGHPQRDLKATDFAISEDGVAQQVGLFALGNLSRSI